MKSHNIILCFHGKLITNLFKKNRNVFLKVFICFFVKSKLPVRRIPHICINDDRFVRTIKTKFIHFLTIILPHYPLVGEHLPDELWKIEPKSNWLADGKVTIPTFTAQMVKTITGLGKIFKDLAKNICLKLRSGLAEIRTF